jgi:hypothetical protein
MEKQYDTNNIKVQNNKQKTIKSILETQIAKKMGLAFEDLEPYWVEFRLMSNKKNFLDMDGLRSLLNTLNVPTS